VDVLVRLLQRGVAAATAATLILAVAGCSSDVRAFDQLDRAAVSVQSAVTVGVTVQAFSALVASFATEQTLAERQIKTDKGRAVAAKFHRALDAYAESLEAWQEKIKSPEGAFYLSEHPEGTEAQLFAREIAWVAKYHLVGSTNATLNGIPVKVYSSMYSYDSVIRAAWLSADQSLKEAEQLRGKM
jgi:hypothetical protein